MHHHKHYHATEDLRVPMYSRSSTFGLALASVLSLLAMFITVVMLAM